MTMGFFHKFRYFFVNFLRETSIHGFVHIVSIGVHLIERTMWFSFVALAFYGTASLSQRIWQRYQESPTVISIDRNMFFWNTTFPAVTVCPHRHIDDDKLTNYLNSNPAKFPTQDDREEFTEFISKLSGATFENFDEVPMNRTFGIPSSDYMELIWNLSWPFSPEVSSGLTNKLTLVETITELGICYAINSHIAAYNSFQYRKANSWHLIPSSSTVTVHPLDGEIYAQIINLSTAYEVYFHAALDIPDISKRRYSFDDTGYATVELTALEIRTTTDARGLSVSQRRCRFTDEAGNMEFSPVYSFNLCRVECRIRIALDVCQCIPHFYRSRTRSGHQYPVCDFDGMKCLAGIKDEIIALHSDRMKIKCKCEENCDNSNFLVQSYKSRVWFLGANLQWGISDYPKMQLIRDVLFRFTDLLVYIGGTAGLFLGCSLLSFTEFIYFFSWRLLKFLMARNWMDFRL
ncbi:pickpocket protein 11 [Lutzomyia longipalpis]|uniref:pickpocket protein 11 n=1 Tax=Lutzomyia longipalpis TaxID=7200 RepID=UPI0024839FBF|nr:pickpocket protein 11 [Lutzomyia longipalpis]